ncbi:NrfD/PsrC family molybdoenzyme membrane anchor subunit [Labilibaculum sp.]|uniref:NrfD/PsrC family molybdoenzyme membrane anchor subunit n=1 Tax=Labilibaculum sp. TaxID=2060723 RepID=UPI002AA795D5|nr:NrfD/PsrC family molybdoenzyme membrane anchor subunit [Labilibaculum sp.]MBN2596016.1 polysulfide reductase NrfD [Marinifilaceae bacterium]
MNDLPEQKETTLSFEKIKKDILRPMQNHKGLELWIAFLITVISVCAWAYYVQLRDGLGVTGMRDYVSWGLYIANFVFFVAVSLVGMLISSILGLLRIDWITPISRIAEIIAVAFVAVAGLVIIMDMGRPDRVVNVLIHGRFQSPILWDITVVTTYLTISLLLLILPMIPDLAICKKELKKASPILKKLYNILSFGYINTPNQHKHLHKMIRTLMVLIVPVGLAIHTVTSWLFAATLRNGWDTTIFGPYFVAGAFVAGSAALIIAMYFFRVSYKLQDYITDVQFDKMGKLMVAVCLVYLYFNLNEFLVPGYKMKTGDDVHLKELFTGHWAIMFWSSQLLGNVIPILLLVTKKFRKPFPIMIISLFILAGAWIKRYVIVIPTLLHPHLPIQNVPQNFVHYYPSAIEISVTVLSFALALLIITVLSKIFPVVPICEIAEQKGIEVKIEA